VLEFDGLQLLDFTFDVETQVAGTPSEIPSIAPVIGAVAVGICPNGFANFAQTEYGAVLSAETGLDGGLIPNSERWLDLQDFNQTPSLTRLDNTGRTSPATSMAVTSIPDGRLFLAISNPAQIAVYIISCQ
jgi:hypothetical protein